MVNFFCIFKEIFFNVVLLCVFTQNNARGVYLKLQMA